MSNPVANITPSAKRDAAEQYLEDVGHTVATRAPARRAFGAGYDAGLNVAAEAVREFIADAEHRVNVVGLPLRWVVELEQLAADLEADSSRG